MSKAEDDHIQRTMEQQTLIPSAQVKFDTGVADWLDGTMREGMKVHGEIYRARFRLAVNAWVDRQNRGR